MHYTTGLGHHSYNKFNDFVNQAYEPDTTARPSMDEYRAHLEAWAKTNLRPEEAPPIVERLEDAFKNGRSCVDLREVTRLQVLPPLWGEVDALMLPENNMLPKDTVRQHFELILRGWVREVNITDPESQQRQEVATSIQTAYENKQTKLKLANMDRIRNLPPNLLSVLDSVTELKLTGFLQLLTLPAELPPALSSMELLSYLLPSKFNMEKWPNTLITLILTDSIMQGNSEITWPKDLKYLDLTDCRMPKTVKISQWPQTLEKLWLSPLHLLPLQAYGTWPQNCKVFRPDEPEKKWFLRAKVSEQKKATLGEAWSKLAKQVDPNAFRLFKYLLSRLTKTEFMSRVKPDEVIQVIKAVIDSPIKRAEIFQLATKQAAYESDDNTWGLFKEMVTVAKRKSSLQHGSEAVGYRQHGDK